MTAPTHENVVVTLAELRAKVDFLTDQRDRARAWAVALEQELAREPAANEDDRRRYVDAAIQGGDAIRAGLERIEEARGFIAVMLSPANGVEYVAAEQQAWAWMKATEVAS